MKSFPFMNPPHSPIPRELSATSEQRNRFIVPHLHYSTAERINLGFPLLSAHHPSSYRESNKERLLPKSHRYLLSLSLSCIEDPSSFSHFRERFLCLRPLLVKATLITLLMAGREKMETERKSKREREKSFHVVSANESERKVVWFA